LEFFQEHGLDILKAHPRITKATKHTTWHYAFYYEGLGWCDYYPSTNKLVVNNTKSVTQFRSVTQ
jgi:hypothetical protein